ncbi:MAG TPA: hypothetical protein VFE66_02985 [Bacteroidales bacterium]|nr:hypothetical protein [Bacteroidales bacterium]
MKFHFDSKQKFQSEAVKAITDIFEGQLLSSGDQLKTNTVLQMRDAEIDFKTI